MSVNIGELTGIIGLNTDELEAGAQRGQRSVDDMAAQVLSAAQRIEAQRFRVKLDADASEAERALEAVRRDLAEIEARPAEARVDGDTSDAQNEIARLEYRLAQINSQRIRVRIDTDTSSVDRASGSATQLAARLAGVGAAGAGIAAGIPAVLGLGAALASLAGIAGTLPALLGAVGAAGATIGIGFNGIGDALTAMGAADSASAGVSAGAGAAREAAMERVRSAVDSLAQAEQQAARTSITGSYQIADAKAAIAAAIDRANQVAIDGARQVASAESALADSIAAAAARSEAAEASLERAQVSARDAQEGLNRAREDAVERIQDLSLALSGAALDEESAQIRLLRAQERLAKAGSDTGSLDYKEAELGVRQAEQALKETTERYGDLQDESAKATAAGVDGADNVVAAQRRLDDANAQVEASAKAVTQAQIDGNKDVARAEEALAAARASAAEANAAADADVIASKEQLRRTEEQVAWAQADAAKQVSDAQRAVAAAIAASGAAAGGAAGGVDKLAAAMAKLSPAGRDLVRQLFALKPAWDALAMDVQERLLRGLGSEITLLAGIYLPRLQGMLGSVADAFNIAFMDVSALLQTKAATDDLQAGFDNIATATGLWTQALEPLTQIFLDLWAVGSEFLPGMAQSFLDGANAAASFIEQARQSGELQAWIQGAFDTLGQLWEILKNVGATIGAIFGAGSDENGAGFLQMIVDITAAVRGFFESVAVQTVLGTLFDLLSTFAPVLIPLAVALWGVSTALGAVNAVMLFAQTPMGLLIGQLWAWVAAQVSAGATALGSMIATAASYVAQWVAMAATAMARAVVMAASWVVAMGPVGWVIAAVVGLVALIIANWDTVVAWTTQAWEAVSGAISAAWDWITGLVSGAVDAVVGFLSDAWNNAVRIAEDAWNNIVSAVQNGATNVLNFIRDLPGNILSALGNLGTLLWNVGGDLISGLWNGILAMGGWLKDQIMWFIKSFVPGPVLEFLGIASPSKLFRDQIGRYIPEGLGEGILANASAAGDAARQMAAQTVTAASAGVGDAMALAGSEIDRVQAYANTGTDPGTGATGTGGRGGAVVNVYNPLAERASDSLNREARTLEGLGIL